MGAKVTISYAHRTGHCAALWLTIALGCLAVAQAEQSTSQSPAPLAAPPKYLGPPESIDGPETVLPPGGVWRDPSSGAVVMPDVDGAEPLTLPGSPLADALPPDHILIGPPQKLSAYKDSFFQKLSLAVDWLGNEGDAKDLGITEVETFVQVGLPAPIKEWPMLITPGFEMIMIRGPTVTDLPPRLYQGYADFMWVPQIVKGYSALISVVPSVFGDFTAHQFRFTGKGLLIVDCVPERLQFVGGVLYLNRENIRLLPAGGFIWTPADWARYELIFPKPKLAQRFNVGPGFEDWVYTTAEFGGNTWPIVRASGVHDNVTYIDYRILVGCERKLDGGAGYRLEAGYVFGRSISFTSGIGDFSPQDTLMLRGGITY